MPNLRDRRGLRETRVSRYQLRVSTRARTGGGWLSRRVSQTGLLTSIKRCCTCTRVFYLYFHTLESFTTLCSAGIETCLGHSSAKLITEGWFGQQAKHICSLLTMFKRLFSKYSPNIVKHRFTSMSKLSGGVTRHTLDSFQ